MSKKGFKDPPHTNILYFVLKPFYRGNMYLYDFKDCKIRQINMKLIQVVSAKDPKITARSMLKLCLRKASRIFHIQISFILTQSLSIGNRFLPNLRTTRPGKLNIKDKLSVIFRILRLLHIYTLK